MASQKDSSTGREGFRTSVNGYNRDDVNKYIAELRRKVKQMEAEMAENNKAAEQTRALQGSLDDKIKEGIAEAEKTASSYRSELQTLRSKAHDYEDVIERLKQELQVKNRDLALSVKADGKTVKNFDMIIARANSQAGDIVDEAKATAREIIAEAKSQRVDLITDVKMLLSVLNAQKYAVESSFSSISASFASIFPDEADSLENLPDPSSAPAPAKPKKSKPAQKPAEKAEDKIEETTVEEPQALADPFAVLDDDDELTAEIGNGSVFMPTEDGDDLSTAAAPASAAAPTDGKPKFASLDDLANSLDETTPKPEPKPAAKPKPAVDPFDIKSTDDDDDLSGFFIDNNKDGAVKPAASYLDEMPSDDDSFVSEMIKLSEPGNGDFEIKPLDKDTDHIDSDFDLFVKPTVSDDDISTETADIHIPGAGTDSALLDSLSDEDSSGLDDIFAIAVSGDDDDDEMTSDNLGMTDL